MKSLYLAASEESKTKLLFDFHGYPFREPATGLLQVRERWYDARTGRFLTPDRMGYGDSSNLFGFCLGDPVNGRDPTGMWTWHPAAVGHAIQTGASWVKQSVVDATAAPTTGIMVVDTINLYGGVAAATQVNTVIDLAGASPGSEPHGGRLRRCDG